MLWNNNQEITILNKQWKNYIHKYRLKNAFIFPKNVLAFINNLKFTACEENKDFYYPTLSPTYEIETGLGDDFPEYKITITFKGKNLDIEKYPYLENWFINSKPFKEFFNISSDLEKEFYNFFNNFKIFQQLENIRIENKIKMYKNKFQDKQVLIKDVIYKNFSYYLILNDGTEAKITRIKPPL